MTTSQSKTRRNGAALAYRPLGTFRFVLALLVVAQHFTNFAPLPFQQVVVPLGIGSIAVLVFFAVSGFVIAEAIEAHYRGRAQAFLINRAIRIFPPLFGALIATIALVAVLLTRGPLASPDMTETQALTWAVLSPANIIGNFAHAIPGMKLLGLNAEYPLIALAWSIRTELMFYLVMGLAVLAPVRLYRPVLLTMAVVGFVLFGFNAITDKGPDSLMFIPFFIFGVAVFYALAGSRLAIVLSGLAAVASLMAFVTDGNELHPLLVAAYGPLDMPVRTAILAVLLASIPLLAVLKAGAFYRTDRLLGDLSYPLYLNHILVMYAVRAFWPQLSWGGLALSVLAALIVSYAMYRLIEPGLNTLRDKVRGGRTLVAPLGAGAYGPHDMPYTVARIARLPV